MTQVINHNLGYKILCNPGHDFDLGYKNNSEFFYYPGFKSVTCVVSVRPMPSFHDFLEKLIMNLQFIMIKENALNFKALERPMD